MQNERTKGQVTVIKKIVLGVLLVGLIGVLVAGAIVRTVDKAGQVAEARGSESGLGGYEAAGERERDCDEEKGDQDGLGQGGTQGQGGLGQGGGEAAGVGNGGRGQGGQGSAVSEAAPGSGAGCGEAQVDEWVRLQGTVASVGEDALVMLLDSGEQLTVENRPWWFAQEQGFSARAGDEVVLDGFYEDDHFEVGQLNNETSEQTVSIREESGRPLWAGRGRRGG
jgi:hypothetical protein